MKKVLFLDRDGVLIIEPEDWQIDSLEKLKFYPGVIRNLYRLQHELGYELAMVTNQDGLGTSSFPENTFWPAHNLLVDTLKGEGITFSNIHIDRTFEEVKASTRKPRTGMLVDYMNGQYDLANSWVIGDRLTDIELAKNLGAKGILLNTIAVTPELTETCKLITTNWDEVFNFLKQSGRKATVRRTTKETDINITVDLENLTPTKIHTGLGFFDHMLEQIARHGGIGLQVNVQGDLHIDEHHTIEDTALALGQAIDEALGSKRGIQRYGFCLPMDDCLAQVALDFGGRPWLVWEAEFKRDMVGDMPTEMFYHFFKSLSDTARCNLNIKVEGENEHHKIESIFKAFAKALKMAIKDEGTGQLPSTKGVL
ncbi:bifunctional histidinol-phosphatase/imidazoleglycerol-phosphate dehydratase HisB [soil metagenome]